jgi:peptidoglycan-associated lipoprotein
MVLVLGILEIAKEPRDGVTEARIVSSFDAMAPGDLLKPFAVPPPVPAQQVTSGPITGMIVDFKVPRQITSQGEIVYIDRGETDGVALGDRFSIARPGRRLSAGSRNPDQALAEIKVVGLQARTATAYVLHSSDALQRGDIITRLPPPPPKPEPAAADAMAVAKAVPPEAAKPPAPPKPVLKDLEDVHFAFNKWDLSDQAKKTLAEHAGYLKENPTLAVTIEGHADERGSPEFNHVLGEKRAEEVRRFFADAGVKNALTVTSFGKDRPLCTDRNETCYTKNRRVHLAAGN